MKILNNINIRNIQEMYDLKSVLSNGQIELKTKNVIIYKIDPANIIACDEETKFKIYQAYLTCIRGLPDCFQFVISKQKANFSNQINEYKQRINKIENEGLKLAIKKYVEYLEEISNVEKLYKTSHYLIIENMSKNDLEEIVNVFSNLREFGVRIEKISKKDEVNDILRKSIFKDETNGCR